MNVLVTRAEALVAGAKRYFTGIPCIRGHVSERQTSSKMCMTCAAMAPRSAATIAKDAQRGAEWFSRHREREIERRRANYAANREERCRKNEQYRATRKDEQSARRRRHYEANAARYKAHAVARRDHVKQATPPWADAEAIVCVYKEAARLSDETGVAHHVDHEIPLRGRDVCGLHVESNLRPMPAAQNLRKANRSDHL